MQESEPGEHCYMGPGSPRHGGHVFGRLHGSRVEESQESEGPRRVRRSSRRGVERVQAHIGFVATKLLIKC